jgi:large subunit ribosomal protein L35
MPKTHLKTHKGLKKRVRVTGSGKVKHKRRGTSHLNSGLTGSKHRELRQDIVVPGNMARKMQEALHQRLTGPKQAR